MAKLTGRCYSPRQFFLYSSFSSPVRPCIFFLECPVSGAVAAEDGALELLLLETTEMVATPVRTLVYYFPLSSFWVSSGFAETSRESADAGRSSCLQPSFLLLALFFFSVVLFLPLFLLLVVSSTVFLCVCLFGWRGEVGATGVAASTRLEEDDDDEGVVSGQNFLSTSVSFLLCCSFFFPVFLSVFSLFLCVSSRSSSSLLSLPPIRLLCFLLKKPEAPHVPPS